MQLASKVPTAARRLFPAARRLFPAMVFCENRIIEQVQNKKEP